MLIEDLKSGVYYLEKRVERPAPLEKATREGEIFFLPGHYFVRHFKQRRAGVLIHWITIENHLHLPPVKLLTSFADGQKPLTPNNLYEIQVLAEHLVAETSTTAALVEVLELHCVEPEDLLLELANCGAITREQILEACESIVEAQDA